MVAAHWLMNALRRRGSRAAVEWTPEARQEANQVGAMRSRKRAWLRCKQITAARRELATKAWGNAVIIGQALGEAVE